MDRLTNYFGQVPLETDLLHTNQNTMVALAKFCAAVLGTNTIVNGFTCTPTTPATLSVVLNPGEIYQLENLEATAWSSLSADNTHSIVKQGIQLNATTFGITPPPTFGFSQVFLVEVQYADLDSGLTILPYFNSANPAAPFTGPGNSGSAQNTVRQGIVASQIKAGNAAATGTQIAPTADAGWTGLFLITVANGAATITAGNIVQLPAAPFIPATLPAIPADVQAGAWIYATDIGTVNNLVANVSPAVLSLVPGTGVRIKVANSNTAGCTFNLNGLGANAIHRANGANLSAGDINASQVLDLVFDGSAWQVSNFFGFTSTTTNNNTTTVNVPYCADSSGTPNIITAPFSPAIVSLSAGLLVLVKLANTVTGPATIGVNALTPVAVTHVDTTPLRSGDADVGEILALVYDGTQFQLINHIPTSLVVPVGNPTLWVRTDGNDNNDGSANSAAKAFQTINGALARSAQIFSLQGKTLTIQLGIAGTYTPFTANPLVGSIVIAGGGAGYTIQGTGIAGAVAVCLVNGANVTLQNVSIINAGTTLSTVGAVNGGSLTLAGNITIGATSSGNTVGSAIVAQSGGSVTISGSLTLNANMGAAFLAEQSTIAATNGSAVTFAGGPAYAIALAVAEVNGSIVFSGVSVNGAAGGSRFQATLNGVIFTFGGGVSYFPGTSPGTTSTGGQYG